MSSQVRNAATDVGSLNSPAGAHWSGIADIASSNDVYATSNPNNSSTDYIGCDVLGFTIPDGGRIDGIQVDLERHSDQTGNIVDAEITVVKNQPSFIGNLADTVTQWGTTDAVITYGGPTELWGTTWTRSEINANGFGAYIRARETGSGPDTAYVDCLQVTVYYTPGQLVMTTEPVNTAAGATMPTFALDVEDVDNVVDTNATGNVTATPNGFTLSSGTTTLTPSSGAYSVSDWVPSTPATGCSVTFTNPDGLTVTSATFDITAAAFRSSPTFLLMGV